MGNRWGDPLASWVGWRLSSKCLVLGPVRGRRDWVRDGFQKWTGAMLLVAVVTAIGVPWLLDWGLCFSPFIVDRGGHGGHGWSSVGLPNA